MTTHILEQLDQFIDLTQSEKNPSILEQNHQKYNEFVSQFNYIMNLIEYDICSIHNYDDIFYYIFEKLEKTILCFNTIAKFYVENNLEENPNFNISEYIDKLKINIDASLLLSLNNPDIYGLNYYQSQQNILQRLLCFNEYIYLVENKDNYCVAFGNIKYNAKFTISLLLNIINNYNNNSYILQILYSKYTLKKVDKIFELANLLLRLK